ncbi:NUDIX hydrolase [Hyphococcus sp.]|jgi:8-oxo-dGTP diphosphatase|uniref:NUDIX hydrolase n=1 Tax=Hyphococcus sp. TaxID=2038636 RepID=UPI003D11E477
MTGRENIFTSVGAVVFKGEEALVIRRGREPLKGQWSIPGGKVDYGERLHDAVAREVREETGVEIEILGLLDVFESLPAAEGAPHYVMVDFIAEWVSGEPRPGDDAEAAEFVPLAEARARIAWDTTRRAMERAAQWRAGKLQTRS